MRCLTFLLSALISTAAFAAEPLRLLAAVSLSEALKDAAAEFEKTTGTPLKLSFGASGTLAMQVSRGGAGDVLISAAVKQVDGLIASGNAVAEGQQMVSRNVLVLITPPAGTIASFESLAEDGVRKLAIGEPKVVPAGMYAKQAIERLKLFDALKPKIVYAEDVRQVLAYVRRGDVDAGIVYRTDARQAGDAVRIAATADTAAHEPIVYPGVVLTRAADRAAATALLRFLASPQGQKHFTARGFVAAVEASSTRPADQGR